MMEVQSNQQYFRKINDAGLALVTYTEGLSLTAEKDSVGIPTIGYGRIKYDDGTLVKLGDTCNKFDAERWLQTDLWQDGGHFVTAWIKTPLNDNQYSALISFTFNRGAGRLRELLILPGKIEDNLLQFDYAGHPPRALLGLRRRRRMERALYRGEDWNLFKSWIPA